MLSLSAALVAVGAVPAGADGPEAARAVDDPAVTSGLAWHLTATGTPTAWRASVGAGTVVAVVDATVDVGHPDLVGQVVASTSCRGADGDPDRCTVQPLTAEATGELHGTHVAGLVAARADDGIGVAGVAPRARLLVVETLASECLDVGCRPVGDTADVAAGVRWAVDHGADVINLSLTVDGRLGPELTAAIAEAWSAGVVPVLAAGDATGVTDFREAPHAVVVTATERSGSRAAYAPDVDSSPLGVAAPGGVEGDDAATCRIGATPAGIVSTAARGSGDGSGYACLAGTSMAVPQVSGGLALLLSMGFSRDDAVDRLLGSAHPGPGLGAGEIDLAAATAAPYPAGVSAHPSSFATTTPRPQAVAASVGPFAVAVDDDPPLPGWLLAVTGGLVAGTVADLGYRAQERRKARRAAADGPPLP